MIVGFFGSSNLEITDYTGHSSFLYLFQQISKNNDKGSDERNATKSGRAEIQTKPCFEKAPTA
jgi:hypothetical protein